MKGFEPVQGVGDQEIAHLVPSVVEDQRAPVLMLALSRIAVFVERGAVKPGQGVRGLGKVLRHPVEDHPDDVDVTLVKPGTKILRYAVAARRRDVSADVRGQRWALRIL